MSGGYLSVFKLLGYFYFPDIEYVKKIHTHSKPHFILMAFTFYR